MRNIRQNNARKLPNRRRAETRNIKPHDGLAYTATFGAFRRWKRWRNLSAKP